MQPHNIIVPDDESIKFIDPTLIHFKMNGFMKTRLGMETAPLSPELMTCLQTNMEATGDQQASEVWSIGIVILSMATLSDYKSYYNFSKTAIDQGKVES